LNNHEPDIAAMDLFVVPTVGFDLLYALVVFGTHRWLITLVEHRRERSTRG
jgi:hypothetical protein